MPGVYIIAEAGVNHNGSLDLARLLVDRAAEAGANAVKFQSFIAAEVISNNAPKAGYQQRLTPAGESQLEMVRKLQLTAEQHLELLKHCRSRQIDFLSTPFDFASVDLLTQQLQLPLLKIASGEITNTPLLLKIARTGRDVLLSTGMSSLGEVETALAVLAYGFLHPDGRPSSAAIQESFASPDGQQTLRAKVTLLHCTSEYPAPWEEINLRAMDTLRRAFGLSVGYSDHSRGVAVPIAAAARGATVIEKHFTLDRSLPGPDHQASLEPPELIEMVEAIRQVELALGSFIKCPTRSELNNRPLVRRSLVARKNIKRGDAFTEESLGLKRPGTGTAPDRYWDYLDRTAGRDYQADEVID